MSHGQIVCGKCGTIMGQCRCMENHTGIASYSTCNECKENTGFKKIATKIIAQTDHNNSEYKSTLEIQAGALARAHLDLLNKYEMVVSVAKKLFTATCGSEFKDAKEDLRLLVEKGL